MMCGCGWVGGGWRSVREMPGLDFEGVNVFVVLS